MIDTFAKHPVAANLTMVAMILAGLWAVRVMPTQLDPPANYPFIWVEVTWEGASAEDLEALVTRPLEQALKNLPGLRELNSRSSYGQARLAVQLTYDADLMLALDQTKQRVASIRNLPPDIEPPVIRRALDFEPIMQLTLTGPGSVRDLVPLARTFEAQLLARGVESVEYDGLPEEEIALLVNRERLPQLGATLPELAAQIRSSSSNVPAGALGAGQGAMQLRSLGQERTATGFESLLLRSGDTLVRLGDIATVTRQARPGQPALQRNGQPAIEMVLWRDTAADAYLSARIVDDWLEEITPQLPPGVTITRTLEVWQLLRAQLEMIGSNGLSGLVLVLVVLFTFLSARAGWWVMVGMPVSFLLALAIFYLGFGYGISIIALIGLIMALGIVVDDAIVVGEDIVTLHQQGATPAEAAVRGARRMFVPVATSSATTLAAFLPLLIIGGMLGDAVLALPTLLLCVIIASLIECFLVLPGHLRHSLEHPRARVTPAWRVRFNAAFEGFRDQRFLPLLQRALAAPGATLCAALGAVTVALSLIASGHVGFNLVTGFDFESLEANVSFSASATEADKAQFLVDLERALVTGNETHDSANLTGWTSKARLARFNGDRYTGEEYASLRADYAFEEFRTVTPEAFVAQWRDRIQPPGFVEQFELKVAGGAAGGEPDLTLVLQGDDLTQLKAGGEALAAALAAYPGVTEVSDNLPYGKAQIIFTVLPAARELGLSTADVGRQLRAAYSGERVQLFNEADSEIEVRLRLPEHERRDIEGLRRFPIRTADNRFVPLGNIADLRYRRGIDLIRHADGALALAVNARVNSEQANALAILEGVREDVLPDLLQRFDLSYDLGGQSQADAELLAIMQIGALLTLVLIYLILAWAFASYLWPLAIMMAIPFGFTGAVAGHWLLGVEVGAMSLLAFFSLTGIVVNDSIVLVSFLRRELEKGLALRAALIEAVRARFRAVLLTSLTTIAGLAPLLFERSTLSMYTTPIAVTLCFGLAFATLLVLIVIPALLLLLEGGKGRLKRLTQSLRPAAGMHAEPGHSSTLPTSSQGARS
ncbi:MAG: efflux RND transporter permease subunit [Pseudomonadota bacterium]